MENTENEGESKVEARVKYYDEILPIMLIDAKQDLSGIANNNGIKIKYMVIWYN